jgi:hypothetical protein
MPGQTPRYAKKDSKPVESEHIKGPQGLDSWTLDWPLMDSKNDEERYPFTLVIARNGRVIRRNQGSPFIWKWMFWDHGRQVAYEAGPLHFSMACVLVDTDTGRQLAEFDCEYVDLPKDAPEWLKALVR